ncbi:Ig-like domain-containing protein [Candidatus Lokiarchaeum ossiferum]|uniref:Ig-like domain-containing protein n=1 Tax=Candidatus Lokiarchaeum ossiferum TaxID=2951803 RepID=UPI00352DED4F
MKYNKSMIFSLVFVIVCSNILTLGAAMQQNQKKQYNYAAYEPIDLGPEIRGRTMENLPAVSTPDRQISSSEDTTVSSVEALSYYADGDIVDWYGYDMNDGTITLPFELRGVGNNIEIWVALDLSFPDDREVPVITDEQVAYMIDEFDNNIYPIDTTYFGSPDFHDGSSAQQGDAYYEESGRSVMLVSNIRDDMYYDASYPYYIVGFYWGVFEQAFDRNIISIDCMDWENRIGDDVLRPNLYEGVVAHEYQHLIHDDYNSNDDTFMNEGCSMYAEPLCGYGVAWGDIEAYLATPDNSLTVWEDQGGINILADYGSALMWTVYLSDHYGGAELISHFVQAGVAGVTGINQALAYFGYTETFEDVYHDWRIANLIHTTEIGGGKYDYTTFDLDELEPTQTRIYDIDDMFVTNVLGSSFGETLSYLGDATGVYELGSYGSDYVRFNQIASEYNPMFSFNGDDGAPAGGRRTTETDFLVSLISVELVGGVPTYTAVETLILDDSTETTINPFALGGFVDDGYVLMIASADVGLVDYSFSIEQGSTASDTVDPVVSITSPADAAIVSDSVSIEASASDNIGVSYVQYSIDGGSWISDSSAPYTWVWDSTTVVNGNHIISVRAYDAAGNYGEDSISVTVDNEVSGDVVYVEETLTGSIAKFEVDYFAITAQPGMMEAILSWSNNYNLDVYICNSADYTDSIAIGNAGTNPESCSVNIPSAGTYYIAVRMVSRNAKTTAYSLNIGYYTLA